MEGVGNGKDDANYLLNHQANLVSIHSEGEHQFVVDLSDEGFPWIGGERDPGNPDNWRWSDGTDWDYDNWATDEPNNNGDDEDCVHLSTRHGWNDLTCSAVRSFVCKIKIGKTLPLHYNRIRSVDISVSLKVQQLVYGRTYFILCM